MLWLGLGLQRLGTVGKKFTYGTPIFVWACLWTISKETDGIELMVPLAISSMSYSLSHTADSLWLCWRMCYILRHAPLCNENEIIQHFWKMATRIEQHWKSQPWCTWHCYVAELAVVCFICRVNCSFFFKIGACRHGERCSRLHNKPTFSQTILLQNLYLNPQNAAQVGDPSFGMYSC